MPLIISYISHRIISHYITYVDTHGGEGCLHLPSWRVYIFQLALEAHTLEY